VLALLPATLPLPTTGWDKANHALAFAVTASLGARCWPDRIARVRVGLAIYGGAIEIAQTLTATRMGEWTDWLADLVGLAVAAAFRRV
jgi:VanZ family protein